MTSVPVAPLFHGGRLKRQRALSVPLFSKNSCPLQGRLEQDLAERVRGLCLTKIERILLYGARTPILVDTASTLFPDAHIVLADPVLEALPCASPCARMVMDETKPCLSGERFDLIVSCATLAFAQDPLGVLRAYHHLLTPKGVFLTSFLGGNTLHEVSAFLLAKELKLTLGASQRIMPMIRLDSALALLQGAGFQSRLADHEALLFSFKTLEGFRRFLKNLGAQAPLYEHPFMSKALYQAILNDMNLDTVTFDLINLIGWKNKEAYPSLIINDL